MKKLIFILIKSILITFTIFSFVACGGGGSSGGDDYYDEPEIPSVSDVVETPAVPDEVVAIPSEQPEQSEPDDADGSIRIGAPRYSSLPVTLNDYGSLKRNQEVTLSVQQDYETYAWYFGENDNPQSNGKTYTFTPSVTGIVTLRIEVTNNGSRGSLSVNLAVGE